MSFNNLNLTNTSVVYGVDPDTLQEAKAGNSDHAWRTLARETANPPRFSGGFDYAEEGDDYILFRDCGVTRSGTTHINHICYTTQK